MKKHPALYIAQAAVIAAMYAALTILQNILLPGSASMAIQFRVAEVLAILAVYTHAAIPGLTVGCMVANISSLFALGPYDLIFGALASFFAPSPCTPCATFAFSSCLSSPRSCPRYSTD